MNFLLRSNQSKKTCFLSRVVLIGVLWCERHHGMDIKTWGKWILHQLVIIALPCSGTIAERSPLSAHIMVQCVLLFVFCLWIILGPVSPSWLCDPLFFYRLQTAPPPREKLRNLYKVLLLSKRWSNRSMTHSRGDIHYQETAISV